MFVVKVRLPNCFPFVDAELFLDPDDAVKKAYEWLKVGAVDVEVMDAGTHIRKTAAETCTLIGLGLAFGYETVKYEEAA